MTVTGPNTRESCYLLHPSESNEHAHCITVYTFSLHWVTWGVVGGLLCLALWRLAKAAILSCGQHRTFDWAVGIWRRMFSLIIPGLSPAGSCAAAPISVAGCDDSLKSTTAACLDIRLCFSGHLRWRWQPLHNTRSEVSACGAQLCGQNVDSGNTGSAHFGIYKLRLL
jgi:hypothetical protein